MIAPTRKVNVKMAVPLVGSSPACSSTLLDERAMALVKVMSMSWVLELSEPVIVGTMPAYRLRTGLKPPSLAYAIPSGMLNNPATRPAITSEEAGRPSPIRLGPLVGWFASTVAIAPSFRSPRGLNPRAIRLVATRLRHMTAACANWCSTPLGDLLLQRPGYAQDPPAACPTLGYFWSSVPYG